MKLATGIGGRPETIVAQAQAAEAAGFDIATCGELAHDSIVTMTLAANATEKINTMTSVTIAFPRSPMVLAMQAWDIQRFSKGRFNIGLGSQVKGHNERRFSIPWSPPAPRLREYAEALRAIWRCWEQGEPLNFEGEHYRFTLMTPRFTPASSQLPMVPITMAAVGPAMLRLAGRVCDGVQLHPFCTRRYLDEVCLPQLQTSLSQGGRQRPQFDVIGGQVIERGQKLGHVTEQPVLKASVLGRPLDQRKAAPILLATGITDHADPAHLRDSLARPRRSAQAGANAAVRAFTAVLPRCPIRLVFPPVTPALVLCGDWKSAPRAGG